MALTASPGRCRRLCEDSRCPVSTPARSLGSGRPPAASLFSKLAYTLAMSTAGRCEVGLVLHSCAEW